MRTVTFYSYKGGVGRTLAMANVGRSMARAGDRVLLVDFDLEAPGLSIMSDLGSDRTREGVVDFVAQFLGGANPDPLAFRHPVEGEPNLYIMPAGVLDAKYPQKLANLDFAKFYNQDGAKALKSLFRDLTERDGLSYVIIDSRTGFSDYGWLCVVDLADIVVVVTGLNDQNIQGTTSVLNTIRKYKESDLSHVVLVASLVPEGEEELKAERFKEAETTSGLKFAVSVPYNSRLSMVEDVSFVDWQHSGLARAYRTLERNIRERNPEDHVTKRERARALSEGGDWAKLDLFREAADANPKDVAVHSWLGVALGQKGDYKESVREFRRASELADSPSARLGHLTNTMISWSRMLDSADPDKLRPIIEDAAKGALEEVSAAATIDAPDDADVLRGWAANVADVARALASNRKLDAAQSLWAESDRRFGECLNLNDSDARTLAAWGEASFSRARVLQSVGSDTDGGQVLSAAADRFRRALAINADSAEILTNLGAVLGTLAAHKSGDEADQLLAEAVDCHRKAFEAQPGECRYLANLGAALGQGGEQAEGDLSRVLLRESIEHLRHARELVPNEPNVVSNLANALSVLAERSEGQDARNLRLEAIEDWRGAVSKGGAEDPGMLALFSGQLLSLAEAEQDPAADELRTEAVEHLHRALSLLPQAPDALGRISLAITKLAGAVPEDEVRSLCRRAVRHFRKVVGANPDNRGALNALTLTLLAWSQEEQLTELGPLLAELAGHWRRFLDDGPDAAYIRLHLSSVLRASARMQSSDVAQTLIQEAVQLLREALDSAEGSTRAGVFRSLAASLSELSLTKPKEEQSSLRAEALALLDQADSIEPGSAAYNRACLLAGAGREEDSLAQLADAIAREPELRRPARKDPDFESLRGHPEFEKLIGESPKR